MTKTQHDMKAIERVGPARLPRRGRLPRNTVSLGEALDELSDRPDLLDVDEIDSAAIEIGLELKRARERKGLTQVELAAATGIAQGAVSDIERGKGKDGPSYRVISDIARALDAEIAIEPRLKNEPYPSELLDWLTHTDKSTKLALIDQLANGRHCMPFVRSLLRDDVYSKLLNAAKKVVAGGARYKVAQSAVCGFWNLPAHEQARMSPKTAMVVVAYNGNGALRVVNKRRSQIDDRVVLAKHNETIEVVNSGDSALSVLTMPVTIDFPAE